MRGSLHTLPVLLAASLALTGCKRPGFPPVYHQGVDLERQGKDRQALAAYVQAVNNCRGQNDACAQCRLRRAEALTRLGRHKEAVRAYLSLAGWRQVPQSAARARDRAADLLERRLKDPDRALSLSLENVTAFPAEVAAEDSLARVVRLYSARGKQRKLIRLLMDLYARLKKTDLADNLLFSAATLYRDNGQRDQALRLYDRLAADYPRSGLQDDALWQAVRLLEQQESWDQALVRYRRLLATRKDAFLVGSYNSTYLDDAQLKMALVYLQRFNKPKRALAELRLLRDDFKDSVLRDDAQWWIATIHLQQGNKQKACAALTRLTREFPDGNHAVKAKRKLEEWGCQ